MNVRDRGETDAIVRRLRGYANVWADPPVQQGTTATETRTRMGALIRTDFLALDLRLCDGDPLPEFWDPVTLLVPRTRERSGDAWEYTLPPGRTASWRCTNLGRRCDWIDPAVEESACRRCHTIRIRVK